MRFAEEDEIFVHQFYVTISMNYIRISLFLIKVRNIRWITNMNPKNILQIFDNIILTQNKDMAETCTSSLSMIYLPKTCKIALSSSTIYSPKTNNRVIILYYLFTNVKLLVLKLWKYFNIFNNFNLYSPWLTFLKPITKI